MVRPTLVALCLLVAARLASSQPVAPSTERSASGQPAWLAQKASVAASIDAKVSDLARLSDAVWSYAELGLREKGSAEAIAAFAESHGFRVRRGVAGMPTAFVAEYGQGLPVIGILGEYDALPGLSQKAEPVKAPLVAGAPGHGCGHNLLGVASLGAAIAIKEQIAAGKLAGTIRYYGTPAEESDSGKIPMLRDGLFKDADVVVSWHPSDETSADTKSSQALVSFTVEFHGKTAHAAADPWNGRSAVDGLEIFTHAINMMREHVKPTVRIHYSIQRGGDVPNVVPDYARLVCWVRDSDAAGVADVMARVRKAAAGAALAADVQSELKAGSGIHNMIVNMTGQRLVHENLRWLGPLTFSAEEQEFAKQIQKATDTPATGLDEAIQPFVENPGPPDGGSTDVGDVSWIVPTLQLGVVTAPKDAPWHAWPVVACGGMSIGHKGMTYAAKAMAATMVDLFTDPAKRAAIKKEFADTMAGKTYKSLGDQ